MRLDEFLFKYKYYDSRTKAKQAIERKEVYVNGKLIDKSSFFLDENALIAIEKKSKVEFVSLGGYKLDKAIDDFSLEVEDLICADVGASTGGFTDCLLKRGAKKVFSIDLNDSLLHYSLKENEKVVSVIKNAKDLSLKDFDMPINFLCADLSFISATLVLPVFYNLLPNEAYCVLLVKPQFESNVKKHVKNGVIRDEKTRVLALKKVFQCAIDNHFCAKGLTVAPLNKDKNVEYLLLLKKSNEESFDFDKMYKNLKF